MAQEKLVCNPFLHVVEELIVVVDVLGGMEINGFSLGRWIRLHNSRRLGHMLVGCPSLSHSVEVVWARGGSGDMGSFFLHIPLVVVVMLLVGVGGGVVGSYTGMFISNPFARGGKYGLGTIESRWRYHIGMVITMFGRVRVEAT
jgi:hypothetical protein